LSGLNAEINQVGDICSTCNKNKLVYVRDTYPYSEEYLWCKECNSTYNIKYKQMWTEDINSLACDMYDTMKSEFKKRGMKLTNKKSDELYEKIQDLLEEFGTGDYKNYN